MEDPIEETKGGETQGEDKEDKEDKGRVTEEGSPILGDIESGFGGIEEENKKNLRNKLLLYGGVALGVVVIITIILILVLSGSRGGDGSNESGDNQGESDNPSDKVDGDPVGNIYGIFKLNNDKGEAQILSEDFDYQNNVVIYRKKKNIIYKKLRL